jgi:cysteine desulfuration protein SufE
MISEKLQKFTIDINSRNHLEFYEHLINNCGPEHPTIKYPTNLVQGCISKTYLAGHLRNGRLFFEVSGESKIVQGFGRLLCEIFDGSTPREILDFQFPKLDQLRYKEWLTPSRQNGFKQMFIRIKRIAQDNYVG